MSHVIIEFEHSKKDDEIHFDILFLRRLHFAVPKTITDSLVKDWKEPKNAPLRAWRPQLNIAGTSAWWRCTSVGSGRWRSSASSRWRRTSAAYQEE